MMTAAVESLVEVVVGASPQADLADKTGLVRQLRGRLPADAFRHLMARAGDMADPSERASYLIRADRIIGAYQGIVDTAQRIVRTNPRSADVWLGSAVHRQVPVHWDVLCHIALTAGWVRVGSGRLQRNGAGRDTTSPSYKDTPGAGTDPPESSAAPARGSVILIVAYEADGARFMPRIRGEELLEFRVDGQAIAPPAPTLDGIYRWLGTNGYVPDGEQFKWLDRREGRRRRRQVYVHRPRDKISERRLTHGQAWDEMRGYRLGEL